MREAVMKVPLASWPYPPTGNGYWNPITATINWCEEDYYATYYVAEIVNTLTNLFFIYLAVKGIKNCLQNEHDRACRIAFYNMLFIGAGSFLFHMTLNYWMQLCDELSMIYLTCTTFYASFSYGQRPLIKALVFIFTIAVGTFVTLYYHYLQDPEFHQNAFAIMAITVVVKGVYEMELLLRPSWRGKDASLTKQEQERVDRRDMRILTRMWKLCGIGWATVALGFLLWNLDNIYCSNLRTWRREVGLPWGILLEGHGWWHIFTALTAYYNLVWMSWLRWALKGRQDDVELVWPGLFTSLPKVVRKDRLLTKSMGNGRAKKE